MKTIAPGILLLKNGEAAVKMVFDPNVFAFTQQPVDINDMRLTRVWGKAVYRINLKAKSLQPKGKGESGIFPNDTQLNWNRDNYGPLLVPGENQTFEMTPENVLKYAFTIEKYEGHEQVVVKDGSLFIDGEKVERYTFQQNYYFMMGDNRHRSQDSRYWGFVPETHIVGRAALIWFSYSQSIRWNRLFNLIK